MEKPINPENEPDFSSAFPGSSVTELPLFPLDLVLFPHMMVPLHIFEERYKEMVNRCVKESQPFGIVLATGVSPGSGRTTTREIGCMARIARVERLPDGKMNIEVVGESRFRILDTHETKAYRTGLTELLTDEPMATQAILSLADEVQRLLRDFLTRSLARIGQTIDDFELPSEPGPLSFTAACVLPIENGQKQELLEETDTAARLTVEKDILIREVTRLRRTAEASSVSVPVNLKRYEAYISLN